MLTGFELGLQKEFMKKMPSMFEWAREDWTLNPCYMDDCGGKMGGVERGVRGEVVSGSFLHWLHRMHRFHEMTYLFPEGEHPTRFV